MYYRTFEPRDSMYTIEDLYRGIDPIQESTPRYTIRVETIPDSWYTQAKDMIEWLTIILNSYQNIDHTYHTYHIPKRTGGYRTISEPNDALKAAQRSVYDIILTVGNQTHDCAYAYVKGRTCKNALEAHQANNSKWFYKFDLSNFFPSCTNTVLKRALQQVYPYCCMSDEVQNELIELALLNNTLPQGSPLSPLLSNIIMVPFDWAMFYSVKKNHGVYTRYADDILISYPKKLDINTITRHLQEHLPQGLHLNTEKTRCGSNNGHNYNLGLMLNKNNQITLGHDRKMKLKAKLNNFIYDWTTGNPWCIIDTQVLAGELNYFKQIEPEYAAFVIKRLEKKYNITSVMQIIHAILTA